MLALCSKVESAEERGRPRSLIRSIMSDMSDLLDPTVLADVLTKHGSQMKPADYLEILHEVVAATDDTDALTQAEQTFLVEHGGVDPALLTAAGRAAAQVRLLVEDAAAASSVTRRGLTTNEAAARMGTAAANVRRAATHGDLYVAGRTRNRQHVFPVWQFGPNGEPLPGLREILAALPTDLHPLDVAHFMTNRQEALGDRSPVDWLVEGGDVALVVRLADELGRI
jgi:hypothetical protein